MPGKILRLDPVHSESSLREAAKLISQGKVIIYPTDTLYGIGVDIANEEAIRKVFQIKKREPEKPILILIEKPDDLLPLVRESSSEARRLMKRYWPGPLTLVFKASEKVSSLLTGKGGTIGIRCSASIIVQRLLALTRTPLTATSANLSDQPPVNDAEEAAMVFGDQVDLMLDGGTLVSEPSTIIDVTGETAKLIRQGKFKIAL